MTTSLASRNSAQHLNLYLAAYLLLWFTVVLSLSFHGQLQSPTGQAPLSILLAIVLPLVVFTVIYQLSHSFKTFILALDIRLLILLHSWRMLGLSFLFLYFFEKLPLIFALPAGLGDALVAVSALFLGLQLFNNPSANDKRKILIWNSLGLLDFLIAVSVGILSRTNFPAHFSGSPASDIMGDFPLALIPGFLVPLYITTHLIIYLLLRHKILGNMQYQSNF